MSEYKRQELEKTAEGTIKNFSIPDAWTLYVSCRSSINPEVLYFQDTFVLWTLDELDQLNKLVDKQDPLIDYKDGLGMRRLSLYQKWCITPGVVKDLKNNGQASSVAHPMVYTFLLKKTLHASELKHLG